MIIGGGLGGRVDVSPINKGLPIVFAHKGIQNYYAENSREGFIRSKEAGFSAIETDINQTKDQRLIIFHDRNCLELLGIDRKTSEVEFRQISNKFLIHNNEQTSNTILPLNTLLEEFNNRMIVYLDFKESSKAIADSILNYIKVNDAYQTTLVADQSILFLSYIKFKNPKIKTVLEGFYDHKAWSYYLIPKNFKPDYYACFLEEVNEKHIRFLKKNNLLQKKIVYGVDRTNLSEAYKFGIQNIILDYDSSLNINRIERRLAVNRNVQPIIN